MAEREDMAMRRKKKYFYVTLTNKELKILREGMLRFRNQVIREGGPTEDIDEILRRIL